MIVFSLSSLIVLCSLTCVLTLVLLGFRYRQNNQGSLGGKISLPKSYWLGFALMVYFLLVPVLIWDIHTPEVVRLSLTAFFVVFLLRGIAQLLLMYSLKSWTTKHGIVSNIIGLIALILPVLIFSLFRPGSLEIGSGYVGITALIGSCLLLDSYYAFQFNLLVQGNTQGDKGIWFASADDSAFSRINTITFYANLILSLALLYLFSMISIQ
ncbi:MAG: hypothetical protein AAF587_35975 [Bacteroidota bacterium]